MQQHIDMRWRLRDHSVAVMSCQVNTSRVVWWALIGVMIGDDDSMPRSDVDLVGKPAYNHALDQTMLTMSNYG